MCSRTSLSAWCIQHLEMLAASQMLIDLFLLESTTQQKLMEEEHRMKANSSPPPPWLQDSCTIQFLNSTTSFWGEFNVSERIIYISSIVWAHRVSMKIVCDNVGTRGPEG